MTAVDVDALAKLREAATAGPWAQHSADSDYVIGEVDGDSYTDVADTYGFRSETSGADAALIVAAVNALPDLIAAVRERDALREAVEGLAAQWLASSVLGLSALAGAGRELRRVLSAVDGQP